MFKMVNTISNLFNISNAFSIFIFSMIIMIKVMIKVMIKGRIKVIIKVMIMIRDEGPGPRPWTRP